jgi:4-hydroxy-3-methylbut-2-enyl diphosphate reductase
MNEMKLNAEILLANPRGFCAGVDRAIDIVKRLLQMFGAPIYVRHEIVHNRFVVNALREEGAVFVKELADVPDSGIAVYSAHGVSQAVYREGQSRKLQIFDATCPLVTKVHMEVLRWSRSATECILIGHHGHPEVVGTLGHYDNPEGKIYLVESESDAQTVEIKNPDNLGYVTQTTLSIDEAARIIAILQKRFPNIQSPKREDICYATQNRQDAVRDLAQKSDVVLVVGSPNSSNSNRLRELAESLNVPAYLLDDPSQLQLSWLENAKVIGVTAGASAPESLTQSVIKQLQTWGAKAPMELAGRVEDVVFPLPKMLRAQTSEGATS